MALRVRFSPQSHAHLIDIRAYITANNPRAAELVRGRILETIKMLRTLPRLGHAGRKQGTRELGVAGLPYIVVYRIDIGDEDELVILGVFHGAQDR